MSDIIEGTENVVALILIFGVVGFLIWLIIQFKNSDSGLRNSLSKLAGATGTPGDANYVSASENLSRWNELMLGGNDPAYNAAPTITYVSPQAVPNPINQNELVSPLDASLAYGLYGGKALDLGGYDQPQNPALVMPDGGAVWQWLQKNKVF